MKDSIEPRDLFFRELREKTAGYHQKLEETALSEIIMSDKVTKEAYIDYLLVMFTYTQPFEEAYFPQAGTIFSGVENRRRTDFLVKDLLKLGLLPHELDEADFHFFEPKSIEEIVGAMYVMEGSSLGGRVIFKHIQKKLGFAEDAGASYFYGYGSETGKMWTSFLDELWSFAQKHSKEKIIEGAVGAFKEMYNLFSRQGKYAF